MMDEEQRLQFGDRVYAMRVRLGLNRDDFAARYGLSRWAISAWEEGRYTPLAVARLLVRVMEMDEAAVARAAQEEARLGCTVATGH
jgi:DNA-binding transcriptional regulator YiaG